MVGVFAALCLIVRWQVAHRDVDWVDVLDIEEDERAYRHGTSGIFIQLAFCVLRTCRSTDRWHTRPDFDAIIHVDAISDSELNFGM